MSKIKQSLSWWCFDRDGMQPQRFFKEAKQVGYVAVELLPRELWNVARDAGLVIATHGGHASLQDGLNRRENHNRIEDEINQYLELAVSYQIPNLIVFSGNRNGLGDEEGAANTAEGLRRVAKPAEQKGVTLVLELLNSKVDHKDYQCDHTAWGVQVMKMVNSPRVKLLYDIYHMQIMEGDIIRTIRDSVAYIGHFHTAGNPGRRDMDDTQELNYPPIIRAIAEADYDGYVGHEFIPKGDPIEAIRSAYRLCDL
ncbi:MAG: TIM barrel protein [Chloroflexi bacterium]|nr:TIM barrel protein [Chloroflexota bacterium]